MFLFYLVRIRHAQVLSPIYCRNWKYAQNIVLSLLNWVDLLYGNVWNFVVFYDYRRLLKLFILFFLFILFLFVCIFKICYVNFPTQIGTAFLCFSFCLVKLPNCIILYSQRNTKKIKDVIWCKYLSCFFIILHVFENVSSHLNMYVFTFSILLAAWINDL